MKSEHVELPELLAEIAEVAGLPAALAIAKFKGGTRTHFPARADDDHWLTVTVGREAADKLCKHFRSRNGGISLQVPLGPANFYATARLMALALSEQGMSTSQTARSVGVSSRAVEKWRAAARAKMSRRKPAKLAARPKEGI